MPIPRRAVLAAIPVAVVLALAACGSDAASTASSTPTSSSTTTVTTTAPSSTVLPASTAVGQPVPIGQETTTDVAQSSIDPGDSTQSGPTVAPTTVAGGAGGAPASSTGPASGGAAGPSTGSASSTTTVATTPATTPPSAADGSAVDTLPAIHGGTPFCQFESEIEDKGSAAEDDPAFLAVLKQLEPRMAQWVADAPNNEQRQAATTLHDTTKAAIQSNSVDPFDTDDVTEAMLTVQLYCGATQ